VASILVAEDNPLNFELVRDVLQSTGHTINWAKDGAETLDRLRSLHVDLLLLDLHLPGIDGMGVLATIRKDRDLRRLPVLVISADAMAGVSESVLNEGADAYLAKPFKVKELIRQVEYLLRSETAVSPSA
jgi:CheY-like chemotaxis protein